MHALWRAGQHDQEQEVFLVSAMGYRAHRGWAFALCHRGVDSNQAYARAHSSLRETQESLALGGWFIYGSLAAIVVLGIGVAILAAQLERPHGKGNNLGGFLCLGGLGVALVWLIAAAIVQASAIRPAEITDRSITLNKVSPVFVEAIRVERLSTVEEVYPEDDRPRPRRQMREDRDKFYDPGRPRQKPADVESFEEDGSRGQREE